MSTPLRINALLVTFGAIAGGIGAIPLTFLGKLLFGAPAGSFENYVWNIGAFALMGALFCPVLAWSAMRRVPLWRAISEPAIGAVIGAVAGMLLGSGVAFLGLAAAGVAAATGRLAFAYRERRELPTGAPHS
jgi:hypothetical protein